MRQIGGREPGHRVAATLLALFALYAAGPGSAPLVAQSIREASREGDLETVRSLLAADPSLARETDADGRTPLHHAAARGYVEIAALLIDAGAEVDAADEDLERPLHSAIRADQTPTAELLLERGADVDPRNAYERTPLLLVARETGDADMAVLLIEAGADVDARDRFGAPPIELAAWRGFEPLVDLLLDDGAALPPPDSEANEVLVMFAAERGLDRLFERTAVPGVDLTGLNERGGTLLHSAAQGGSAAIVAELVELGIDLNSQDLYGLTAMHYAAELGRVDVLERLVALGAEPDLRSLAGDSPYNAATEAGRAGAAAMLEALGADTGPPHFPLLEGPYMGQAPPGPDEEPAPFAVGIVSTHRFQHGTVSFSPDGREACWSTQLTLEASGYSDGAIVCSRLEDGRWTRPEVASFSAIELNDDVPVFAPDGNRIYFLSSRAGPGAEEGPERIWYVDREEAGGWSDPVPVEDGPNTLELHWQFSAAADGSLYTPGEGDLYVSRYAGGAWRTPERLPDTINSEADELAPYVTPDEDLLFFIRAGHPENRSYINAWVSFRQPDGSWAEAVLLPEPIATRAGEMCPILSPDGRYLFFNSSRVGSNDNFWVDASFLEAIQDGIRAEPSRAKRPKLSR